MKLISRRTQKLYLKSLSISFLNKCKLMFFAYKKSRTEYALVSTM